MSNLKDEDYRSLNNWRQFYKKNYQFVGLFSFLFFRFYLNVWFLGKLIGRYYDKSGKQTEYLKQVKKLINRAENLKSEDENMKLQFPPCNIEWDAKSGTRVWCTKQR